MGVQSFEDLKRHADYDIECVTHEREENIYNVAFECRDCDEVLLDLDNPNLESNEAKPKSKD